MCQYLFFFFLLLPIIIAYYYYCTTYSAMMHGGEAVRMDHVGTPCGDTSNHAGVLHKLAESTYPLLIQGTRTAVGFQSIPIQQDN